MSMNLPAKLFLMLVSGFLLSLSAPGYNLWFLAWICLSPLFIIINTSKKINEAVIYSFIFGFAYNFWYLHWLFSLHPLSWLGFNKPSSILISLFVHTAVSVLNSLYFVIFAIIVRYLKKAPFNPYNEGIPNIMLNSFLWVLIFNKIQEWEILFGFPWTLIEYSQYKNIFLIQIAECFGSLSIGFLIVIFNFVFSELLIWMFNIERIAGRYVSRDPGQLETIFKGFALIIVLISFSLFTGIFLYGINKQHFSNLSQSVCVLQGNLPLKVTRGGKQDISFAKKTYSGLLSNNNAKLLVIPEGALPVVFDQDVNVQYWLKTVAKNKQADIISGSYCGENEKLTNCAVLFSPQKNKFFHYEKERLVPFGEYTPFSWILPHFLKRFASNLICEGFSKGRETLPIKTSIGNAGINICFELIFPRIVRKHSLEGANLLINLSDLSWFNNDRIKQQFLAFAVFRAIENRRPVIIAANNGISAFIDQSGKINSQSIPNTQGVLIDWINPNNKITFYSKYGW